MFCFLLVGKSLRLRSFVPKTRIQPHASRRHAMDSVPSALTNPQAGLLLGSANRVTITRVRWFLSKSLQQRTRPSSCARDRRGGPQSRAQDLRGGTSQGLRVNGMCPGIRNLRTSRLVGRTRDLTRVLVSKTALSLTAVSTTCSGVAMTVNATLHPE